MGCLFGGYLSVHNEVWLIDIDAGKVEAIRAHGVTIEESFGDQVYHPYAESDAPGLGEMDLVILFVKAMQSREALDKNRHLIGEHTYLMSLQNGAGHENVMADFVAPHHCIIGTTQHNSSFKMPGRIHHGGGGKTYIGMLASESPFLRVIAENFRSCGFDTEISGNIKYHIWNKLFLNSSASVLTAILQVKLGFIAETPHAWNLARLLIEEAVSVANADNQCFDADQVTADVRNVLVKARDGYTSIYADIRDGARTEVDTISGSVIRKARELGISVPAHEFAAALIHAMEERSGRGRRGKAGDILE